MRVLKKDLVIRNQELTDRVGNLISENKALEKKNQTLNDNLTASIRECEGLKKQRTEAIAVLNAMLSIKFPREKVDQIEKSREEIRDTAPEEYATLDYIRGILWPSNHNITDLCERDFGSRF